MKWVSAVAVLAFSLGCGETVPNFEGITRRSWRPPDPERPPGQPDPGTPVRLPKSPPPISGGTLLMIRSGSALVASDPDLDMLWFMSTGDVNSLVGLELEVGDEPGRAVEDRVGRVHVVLRGTGEVADVLPGSNPQLIARRAVCTEPRGITVEPSSDMLYVACGNGELVSLAAIGGDVVDRWKIDDDLRDIAVSNGFLMVTRFRSAEVLRVDFEGHVLGRNGQATFKADVPVLTPDGGAGIDTRWFEPVVAWRMISTPAGLAMTYQLAQQTKIPLVRPANLPPPPTGGYGSPAPPGSNGCQPGVEISVVNAPRMAAPALLSRALPVDVAVSLNGQIAVATAGKMSITLVNAGQTPNLTCDTGTQMFTFGTPVAVGFAGETPIIQVRDPAGIQIGTLARVVFPAQALVDRGHAQFHAQAPAGVACASCHPEGREDGRTWLFEPDGLRRTQTLAGGLLSTAPFHWEGNLRTMDALMAEVLVKRMGAQMPTPSDRLDLANWLNTIQRPRMRTVEATAAARGQLVFEDVEVGCSSCHLGKHLTNNLNADVGTGGVFQVPTLVGISARAPFLHNGCAKTLRDRFGPCGGEELHGHTAQLTPGQLDDLVAYLEAL